MGKIPNFTDSEQLKTLKMDCALKVYKGKEFFSLDSRFVDLENTRERATLGVTPRKYLCHFHLLSEMLKCTDLKFTIYSKLVCAMQVGRLLCPDPQD